MNEQGAGVFVTINETDGKGRKSENIKRIRAVWQEDDDAFEGAFPLESVDGCRKLARKVSSLLAHYDWPADEQGRADFAAVMERMAESFGCDKNAKDLSRVLRVPGFLHRKTETPHLVHIVEATGRRYSRAQIIAAFPPVVRKQKTYTQRKWAPRDDDDQRIRDALHSIDPDDREIWRECGMALKDEMQGWPAAVG